MSFRALTLAAGFVLAASATAADWPQWRGPNQDAISKENGLLKSWPADGPALAWTATNLGNGDSSPIVVNGLVYGVGSRGGQDGVWALKETDGKEAWFRPIDEAKKLPPNNGPGSTPTFAAGKVYAVSNQGTVACLDATTGKSLWKKSYVKDFGATPPIGKKWWGYNDSVLVDGDKVICSPGATKAGVVALKAGTGALIWKAAVPKPPRTGFGYSTPVKATVHGVPMYVVQTGGDPAHQTGGMVGIHADTGKVLWQYERVGTEVAAIPTAIVKDDLVWCSVSYSDGGSALLQLIPAGKDAFTVKELKYYAKPRLNNHHGGMILLGDYVYFGHDQNQGQPVCVELKSGEIKWGPVKPPAGGTGSAAYLYADGLFYVRYQSHLMTLQHMDPDGHKVVASFTPPSPTRNPAWAHPVVANGKLYVRDQDRMFCYNVKPGNTN